MNIQILEIGNPEVRKFQFDQSISNTQVEYPSSVAAQRSPLANKIFGFPWTSSVTVANDHVLVKKQDWVGWDMLAEPLAGLIKEHFEMQRAEGIQNFEENPPAETENVELSGTQLSEKLAQNPQAVRVQQVLDADINPMVASHGGRIALVDVKEDSVYVRLEGGCQGCSSSQATLKQGVELAIKRALPDVKNVVDVTDHASGHNPYM